MAAHSKDMPTLKSALRARRNFLQLPGQFETAVTRLQPANS
jgi:hypothetical protein